MKTSTTLLIIASASAILGIGTGMAVAHGGATDHIHPHGADWVLFLAIVTALGALLAIARR